ncbi:MAG: hypothetical protein KAU14_03905, partial [Thermoplasmata archaeon]|nr:hypothetical protein [Thermoplasmata archaeon]
SAGVNPRSAEEGTEFVFTVRVRSASAPGHPVEVVVEDHAYTMKEVDPSDTNYSDGKDFQYKKKFDEGPRYYFFRCGDHTTRTHTFDVREERLIEYHPDLALAMAIYVAPVIFFLVLLRRMTDTTTTLTNALKEIGESLEGGKTLTKEGDGK